MTDSEIAQIASPDNDSQLSTVAPQAPTPAASQANSVVKAPVAKGNPALAKTGKSTAAPGLGIPQKLASGGDQTPADGVDTQTQLSSPFIHSVTAAPAQPPATPTATASRRSPPLLRAARSKWPLPPCSPTSFRRRNSSTAPAGSNFPCSIRARAPRCPPTA